MFLRDALGRFPVGITTFTCPAPNCYTIFGDAMLRSTGKPALRIEEVAFSVYYPANISSSSGRRLSKGVDWLIHPARDSLRGYAHFSKISTWLLWPLVYLVGVFIKIPAYPNAPLATPPNSDGSNRNQWPLVIFSHGLGGSRTTYSQLCSRIAASGRVVLALEHRDGSGHAFIRKSLGPDRKVQPTAMLYVHDEDIFWNNNNKSYYPLPFRADQLDFRRSEITTAYRAFSRFVLGEQTELETIDKSEVDWESWDPITDRLPLVRCDKDVAFVGHSFGGATVFSMLSSQIESFDNPGIPITKALALDPWLEPFPSSGLSLHPFFARQTGKNRLRTLVINSEGFTLWKDHFQRMQSVMEDWGGKDNKLITIVRARHISFSDFPVLPVVLDKGAKTIMDVISKLSIAFLEGKMEEALQGVKTTRMETELAERDKEGKQQRLVGNIGDIIIH